MWGVPAFSHQSQTAQGKFACQWYHRRHRVHSKLISTSKIKLKSRQMRTFASLWPAVDRELAAFLILGQQKKQIKDIMGLEKENTRDSDSSPQCPPRLLFLGWEGPSSFSCVSLCGCLCEPGSQYLSLEDTSHFDKACQT